MSLPLAISNLTTKTDALIEASDVRKTALDAKVAQAEAEVSLAQAEKTAAEGYRDTTESHAAAAQASLATVKADVTYDGIAAIAASKVESAVDVFVYDTSLDSDGGAWRKRCQHTSWFNEELNTATRGSRREFPAVAVIVAETNKVTIYDGDDPDLPMWMVFNGSTTNMAILGGGYTFTGGLSAFNGEVTFTDPGIAVGSLKVVNFASDTGNVVSIFTPPTFSANYTGKYKGGIGFRNSGLGFSQTSGRLSNALVNRTVNDVAMTVLPDAPVDPDTGLPVPTIAIATSGGVSVIKDDGTVSNSAHTARYNKISISEGGIFYIAASYNALSFATWTDIKAGNGFGDIIGSPGVGNQEIDLLALGSFLQNANGTVAVGGQVQTGSAQYGMMFHAPNESDFTKGMSGFVNAEYTTGWLLDETKGAFLCSTETDPLIEQELLINGGFDSEDGWSSYAGWTISGGVAAFSNPTGAALTQTGLSLKKDSAYSAEFTVEGPKIYAAVQVNGGGGAQAVSPIGQAGTHTVYITPRVNRSGFNIIAVGTSEYEIDNISLKPADADRSVYRKGLSVKGTITRSPVAEGAELVGYSGFFANSYLEQPYNSDLDFLDSASDWSVTWWGKLNSTPWHIVVSKSNFNLGKRWMPGINSSGVLSCDPINSIGSTVVSGTDWKCFTILRRSNTLEAYLNGQFDGSRAALETDLAQPGESLLVGVRHSNDGTSISDRNKWSGLSLLRISATAPTPDQIRKIYEDERKLFQPGAKCTLYGTSDSVTALAHDPKTNLLHVGTSDGRSVFDGLVRVDNTTTPVGTAISAVNGMIVEE